MYAYYGKHTLDIFPVWPKRGKNENGWVTVFLHYIFSADLLYQYYLQKYEITRLFW